MVAGTGGCPEALCAAIAENYRKVRERVDRACLRAGRDPRGVKIVAVSKNRGLEEVEAAWRAGIREFGENRAQEFSWKYGGGPQGASWHFIGHLQTNKVKMVVGKAVLIHSVDSLRLAEALGGEAVRCGVVQDVLLQLNLSGEPSKHGVPPEELEGLLLNTLNVEGIRVKGLMTMAALTEDEGEIRRTFAALRKCREDMAARHAGVALDILSMGMTNDFEIAVEEGADLLRIGTAIFEGTRGPHRT
jgi:pyridoxal phosphate enzyme (YggS family)